MEKCNLNLIKDFLANAVLAAGFEVDLNDLNLEKTKTLEHGHFSTNIAMLLAGKQKKNPREVAETILTHLHSEFLEKAEIAGPGFINLWIEQKFYTNQTQHLIQNFDTYLKNSFDEKNQKTMVIDYSHPNIAKPMGVHHLLSTIIGDSLKKIYRRYGWKVVADNFIGDMGTQFGKLMHAIKTWGDLEEIEKNPIPTLHKLYIQFHDKAEGDEKLDDEGRAEYKKFEEGDSESRLMWEKIRRWSLQEIQPIYDQLEIEFDAMNGESFYEDKMQPILTEGREKGIIVDGEKGAWIIPGETAEETPVLVRKSDGTTIYATRDLARTQYWEETWHPDLMVMVTDMAQAFHFKQVFFAIHKLGLTDALNVNVNFGRMLGMSTRKGKLVLLTELLEEAEIRARELVQEKAMELSEEEKNHLAQLMSINSIKYNILSQNRTTDLNFDWDKMLSFEGNSAPYLMYTLARAKSILRKAGVTIPEGAQFDLNLNSDLEMKVAIQTLMYPEAIKRAKDDFKPNHIANYLYELASDFNSFYNGNSILQAESEALKNSRLLLTTAVIKVMEDGFGLLGMKVAEKM